MKEEVNEFNLKANKRANLKVIKSIYILRQIFSNLKEQAKLNILIYNNYFKKILKINIENYKKISGKYKIQDKNGNCKIYSLDTNSLLFEGEYLNGKKNGKGKEYYINEQLQFEGEYLNGKKNGKGKEYYINEHLRYEGEYLNGKLWNIKGYNINGNFEFEIKSGNGIVKEYDCLGILLFEGEYLDGERNGKGKEYGNLTEEIFNRNELIFEGQYNKGKRHGKGKEYKNYELIFEGEYINGERNGKGKEYNYKKLVYEGEYFKGKKWNGKLQIYQNSFSDNTLKFECEYSNGKLWNGKGYDSKGNLEFEIKDGKGYIKEHDYKGNIIFEGEYLNEKRNGKGKEYNEDGELIFEGEYSEGKRINK